MNGFADLDIITAGRLLRRRGVTSEALVRACLARIDELNPRLNAFITVTRDEALTAAAEADAALARGEDRGPLHGIPISLKDLVDQRGVEAPGANLDRRVTLEREQIDLVALLDALGSECAEADVGLPEPLAEGTPFPPWHRHRAGRASLGGTRLRAHRPASFVPGGEACQFCLLS